MVGPTLGGTEYDGKLMSDMKYLNVQFHYLIEDRIRYLLAKV